MKSMTFPLGILLSLLVISANCQELVLKGIKLGMTFDQVAALHPELKCPPIEVCMIPGKHTVATMRTFAGSNVEKWVLDFRDGGKLGVASLYLETSAASAITRALTDKFGKPEKTEETEFKTQGGLKTTQLSTTWGKPEAFLQVKSRYGNIREMVVRLGSISFIESRNRSNLDKAKKDL